MVPTRGAGARAGAVVLGGARRVPALSPGVGSGCVPAHPESAVDGALDGPGAGGRGVSELVTAGPPVLPLLLWETPPGLEMVLAQEGVPFRRVREAHPLVFAAGRFVLFDGRRVPGWRV